MIEGAYGEEECVGVTAADHVVTGAAFVVAAEVAAAVPKDGVELVVGVDGIEGRSAGAPAAGTDSDDVELADEASAETLAAADAHEQLEPASLLQSPGAS